MPKFDFCPDLWERSALIGGVKQSELVCCHCPLYLWHWQFWCVWSWVLLRWATMARRAKQYQLQRQVCCDPASHWEIRLTLPPAFSYSACQKLVCPLWTRRMSSSGVFLWREVWYMFTKLLRVGPKFTTRFEVRGNKHSSLLTYWIS